MSIISGYLNSVSWFLFQALQNQEGGGDQLDVSFEEGDDPSWSEEEKPLVLPSVGLIKAANSCLKRILGAVKKNGKCDCAKDASQLDNLVERLNEVSPAVDEVVLCLYPPVTKEAIRENVSNNRQLLNYLF